MDIDPDDDVSKRGVCFVFVTGLFVVALPSRFLSPSVLVVLDHDDILSSLFPGITGISRRARALPSKAVKVEGLEIQSVVVVTPIARPTGKKIGGLVVFR